MTAPAVPVKFNNKPMTLFIGLFFMATISLAAAPAAAKLSPAQRIDSKRLGYELQYWVYTPEHDAASALPSLYVTDGAAGRWNTYWITKLNRAEFSLCM